MQLTTITLIAYAGVASLSIGLSIKHILQARYFSLNIPHPLSLPLLYCAYVLLVPFGYMMLTRQSIGSMPYWDLNDKNVWVSSIFVLSYIAGVFTPVVRLSNGPRLGPVPRSQPTFYNLLLLHGRGILVAAFAAKLIQLGIQGPVFLRAYGTDQLAYSSLTSLAVLGEALVAPAAN